MKRWVALLLMACLLCGILVGCSKKDGSSETADTTGSRQHTESEETIDNQEKTDNAVHVEPLESTKPTEPVHEHTFGEWLVASMPTCIEDGEEWRICSSCSAEELRPVAKYNHSYSNGSNICDLCRTVKFDSSAALVELGNIANYNVGNVANYVWDVKLFNGKIYRGAGDYDKNSGNTDFMVFNIAESKWELAGTATDEAIQRYVEIGGKLYAPGTDSRDSGGWDYGNFYTLEKGKWVKTRNVPNGIHCFDMIGFGGKMYIGVATETTEDTVAVSSDNGGSWSYLPLADANGTAFDTSPYEWSRTYAFAEYNGTFYAYIEFKLIGKNQIDAFVFRYDNEKMVYEGISTFNNKVGRNLWQSAFEWKGKCFITSRGLYSVTDFSDIQTMKTYTLKTGQEFATDALLYNDEMYVLSYMSNSNGSYKTAIFKTSTGEANSFKEVVSFDYSGVPYSFDFDGSHFYIGIGEASENDPAKAGMLLRVKPNA